MTKVFCNASQSPVDTRCFDCLCPKAVVDELNEPNYRTVVSWLLSDDTGVSSEAIVRHMVGESDPASDENHDYPRDPSDLGRCLRLFEKCPEWADRIGEMAPYSPGWAGLVAHWSELADLMLDEVGLHGERGDRAPRTFARMRALIDQGFIDDDRYEVMRSADGAVCGWSRNI